MAKKNIKFNCFNQSNLPKEVQIVDNFELIINPRTKIKNAKELLLSNIFKETTNKLSIHKDICKLLSIKYFNGIDTVEYTDEDTIKCDTNFITLITDVSVSRIKNSRRLIIVSNDMIFSNFITFIKKETARDIKHIIFNNTIVNKSTIINNVFKCGVVNSFCIDQTVLTQKKIIDKKFNDPIIDVDKPTNPTISCFNNIMGTIYLIRTREFINCNMDIYKIGKTKNEINKRLGNYGKGGEVLFSIAVNNTELDVVELQLINIFKNKFCHKVDIGNEYFEGNWKMMRTIIYEHITGDDDVIITEEPILIESDDDLNVLNEKIDLIDLSDDIQPLALCKEILIPDIL